MTTTTAAPHDASRRRSTGFLSRQPLDKANLQTKQNLNKLQRPVSFLGGGLIGHSHLVRAQTMFTEKPKIDPSAHLLPRPKVLMQPISTFIPSKLHEPSSQGT